MARMNELITADVNYGSAMVSGCKCDLEAISIGLNE